MHEARIRRRPLRVVVRGAGGGCHDRTRRPGCLMLRPRIGRRWRGVRERCASEGGAPQREAGEDPNDKTVVVHALYSCPG